ncbi:hypothetical protein GCM10011506_13210 [Marivirga lumbricoides]|uniref:MepB family protein n=1 Tax=Marivirga lumbricoides TaxID=1046115 RepID=A0ABQ1LWA7_9BACT|nr:hypothetical protein GCM10011506_13210 [Marivirga lumbricoides]
MNDTLKTLDKLGLVVSDFTTEKESKEYAACRFKLNGLNIIYRDAKTTPKKGGQFVTFWKRSEEGPIAPFHENDSFDFFVVNVSSEGKSGQFVFPKAILVQKGIISTEEKEGKRAFRVYPAWDQAHNKQAKLSQQWQLNYFYEVEPNLDQQKAAKLYNIK